MKETNEHNLKGADVTFSIRGERSSGPDKMKSHTNRRVNLEVAALKILDNHEN